MATLKQIFDVFSKRPEASAKTKHDVPQTTRNRVLLWSLELYSNERLDLGSVGKGDYTAQFWREIHRRLLLRHGRLQLSQSNQGPSPNEAIGYVLTCPGEEFLDFLEDIFSTDCFFHVNVGEAKVVDELNTLLRQDNLPYYLTHFVKEKVKETAEQYAGCDRIYIRAYPKVILKESEILHTNAIIPALTLLQRSYFCGANAEYLGALEDYRKGAIDDCLTKCGSAFESVLKVVCDRKGWPYTQSDTTKTLISTVLSRTNLGTYFEPLLMIVATLRNKLSSSHGVGTLTRKPAPHIAQYALNVTASAIILITRKSGEY